MPRKKSKASSGPNNSYLVSFGDTMTALLAFFIVLNSLAREQTGANLHSGAGSYMDTSQSFGLPGIFQKKQSSKAFQLLESAPQYVVGSDEPAEIEKNQLGPDEDADHGRIIDRDYEQYIRFLIELKRAETIRSSDNRESHFSIDIMGNFPAELSPLPDDYRKAALQIAPLAIRPEYRIEMTVWATTPSESAVTRAVHGAHALRQTIITAMNLPPDAQARLTSQARPWMASDIKRPACSITIRKIH